MDDVEVVRKYIEKRRAQLRAELEGLDSVERALPKQLPQGSPSTAGAQQGQSLTNLVKQALAALGTARTKKIVAWVKRAKPDASPNSIRTILSLKAKNGVFSKSENGWSIKTNEKAATAAQ